MPPFAPLVLRYVLQSRRHQHEGRVTVREGPDDPRPLPDLAVDALDPVVRPDPAPVLRRELRVGQRLDEPVAHRPRGRPEPHRLQLARHFLGLPAACLARFLRMDRLQHARHGFSPGHGNPSQHVAVEMYRAALVAGPGEHLLERTEHLRALITGDEPHSGEPAPPPEPGEELVPGPCGLGVPLGAADDLPVAGGVDVDGDQQRHTVGRLPVRPSSSRSLTQALVAVWRCLRQFLQSSSSRESTVSSYGARTSPSGPRRLGRSGDRSLILARFLTVGPDAPTALAIDAIGSPPLALLRISSILSTPVIPLRPSSRREPKRRHCWADCGWSACPCSKPKEFRAQARNFPTLKPATSRLSNTPPG